MFELDNLNWSYVVSNNINVYYNEEKDLAALDLKGASKLLNIDLITLYVALKTPHFAESIGIRVSGDKTPVILHGKILTSKGDITKRLILEKDLCILATHYGYRSNIKNDVAREFAISFMRFNFKILDTLEYLNKPKTKEENDELEDVSIFFTRENAAEAFNKLNKKLSEDYNFKIKL